MVLFCFSSAELLLAMELYKDRYELMLGRVHRLWSGPLACFSVTQRFRRTLTGPIARLQERAVRFSIEAPGMRNPCDWPADRFLDGGAAVRLHSRATFRGALMGEETVLHYTRICCNKIEESERGG